ncbi:MAG: TetR/AcrR family transcriptional regulator [Burkholderiaceae bacterium]
MRTERTNEQFEKELADLIKARGISAFSVAELAATLRCSRRRLYEIAATKDGLLHHVAKAHFDAMLQHGYEAAAGETDPARAIVAYLYVGVTSTEPLSQAFLKDLESTSRGRQIFDRYQTGRAAGIRQIVDQGIRLGVFNSHNSLVAAEVLLGLSMRIRRPEFLARAGLTISEAFRESYEMVLQGLLKEPKTKRPTRRADGPRTATNRRSPRA